MRNSFIRPLLLGGALTAAAALASCNKAAQTTVKPADTAAIEQALRTEETQWNADAKAKDVDKFAAHYAADATAMMPGAPVMSGAESIKKGLTELFRDPAVSLQFTTDKVGVAQSGDLAYTRGHYTETATDPKTKQPVTQSGSYVTVYKKQADGAWKAVEDINTPTRPAPAQAG